MTVVKEMSFAYCFDEGHLGGCFEFQNPVYARESARKNQFNDVQSTFSSLSAALISLVIINFEHRFGSIFGKSADNKSVISYLSLNVG
jgi:hypothetical protein